MNDSYLTPLVTITTEQPAITPQCKLIPVTKNTTYALTSLYIVVCTVSLVANTLVIRNALHRWRPKSPFECLIINMATADIIDSLFAVPLWLAYIHVSLQWLPGKFGVFLCKLTYFAISTSITVSVLTFSVIAVDRYLAIVSLTKKPLSSKAVKYSVTGIWMVAAAIFSTDLYITQVKVRRGQPICYQNLTLLGGKISKIITILKFLLGFMVPLLIMTALYSKILRFLYKWQIPGNQNESTSRLVQRYRKRTVKKLATLVIAFAVCWFPVHVFHFLGHFNRPVFFCIPLDWLLWVNWLAHTNSAINPCLYLFLSRQKRIHAKNESSSGQRLGRKRSRMLFHFTGSFSLRRLRSTDENI